MIEKALDSVSDRAQRSRLDLDGGAGEGIEELRHAPQLIQRVDRPDSEGGGRQIQGVMLLSSHDPGSIGLGCGQAGWGVRSTSPSHSRFASRQTLCILHNLKLRFKQKDQSLAESSITPAQCRGGRGMLGWNQAELAAAARVSRMTIVDFEAGRRVPYANNLAAIRAALEAAGVEFTNGDAPGVRLRKLSGAEKPKE